MTGGSKFKNTASRLATLARRIGGRLRRDLVEHRAYAERRYRSLAKAWAQGLGASRLDDRPVVVFHKFWAKHREVNLALALRSTGRFQTVLFASSFDIDEMRGGFDEVHPCFSPAQLVGQIRRLSRRAPIHSVICGTQTIDYAQAALDGPRGWPVLVNQYDSFWASHEFRRVDRDFGQRLALSEVEAERDVLPRCDGVIGRFDDIKLLFEKYRVQTPLLVRWDLCDRRFFESIDPREYGPEHEWAVALAGLIWPMALPRNEYGEGQMVRYAADFRAERVHLHIYPSPHLPFHCPDYEREDRENPYFHLHASVPSGGSMSEIARHDFGWMAVDTSHNVFMGDTTLKTILPLRIFGYLEMGLPILCSSQMEAVARIVTKYDCGLVLERPSPVGLREMLAKRDIRDLRAGVGRAREALETVRHAGELVAFLDNVRDRWLARGRATIGA